MKELKELFEEVQAFACRVFEILLFLPLMILHPIGLVFRAAYAGGPVGVVAGLITWFLTGKPFTSVLIGALWAALVASYVLLGRVADGDGEGE